MNVVWRKPLLVRNHVRLYLRKCISHSNQKSSISVIDQESFTFLIRCCFTPKQKDSLLWITRSRPMIIPWRICAGYFEVPKSCKSVKLHNKFIRWSWVSVLRWMKCEFSITSCEHIACKSSTSDRLILSIKASFVHSSNSSNIKTGSWIHTQYIHTSECIVRTSRCDVDVCDDEVIALLFKSNISIGSIESSEYICILKGRVIEDSEQMALCCCESEGIWSHGHVVWSRPLINPCVWPSCEPSMLWSSK